MLKRILWLTLTVAIAACGGDDDDHEGDHDHDASTQKDSGTPMTDAGFSNVACNPSGSGACQNADDCPIIAEGKARSAASSCGQGCLGQADEAGCARTCVVKETHLSTTCADCYVGIVRCTIMKCLSACAANPESPDCFKCQVDMGCRSTFDTCSGLPPAE